MVAPLSIVFSPDTTRYNSLLYSLQIQLSLNYKQVPVIVVIIGSYVIARQGGSSSYIVMHFCSVFSSPCTARQSTRCLSATWRTWRGMTGAAPSLSSCRGSSGSYLERWRGAGGAGWCTSRGGRSSRPSSLWETDSLTLTLVISNENISSTKYLNSFYNTSISF